MHSVATERFRELTLLVVRNVFVPINFVLVVVEILLVMFGQANESLFLGIIIALNIVLGLVQDIRSWLTLERLRLLTAARSMRTNDDGTTTSVSQEELQKGDRVSLTLGDQVPCDGILILGHGLEVSEAFITGESQSIPKKTGDAVLAGSIVTSGKGTFSVTTEFRESRIAKMTEKIKRFSLSMSPIQQSINIVVRYTGYILFALIIFVVIRGKLIDDTTIHLVRTIGALASVLVPQGLVIATTALFALGAAHMLSRQVLLQEINATEKLGRIKHLCFDKTGTLTGNDFSVVSMHVREGLHEDDAKEQALAYTLGSGDTSVTIRAINTFLHGTYFGGEIVDTRMFSSERRFGGVYVKDTHGEHVIIAGAPDILLPHLTHKKDKEWLEQLLTKYTQAGMRMLCVTSTPATHTPVLPQELTGISLTIVAVFVLQNNPRVGIHETISFFQNRGVSLRVISGDYPDTVRTIAASVGIKQTDRIVTGAEMETWSDSDFDEKVQHYTIFARVKPEQKERIVESLKKDGFTAMIGDGANDALAIKKADLGIAMFDSAPATRQLASVVLMKNSFTDLPEGVKLADSIIKNIDIFASIFFNQTFLGLFLFVLVSILGHSFPFAPLNINLINNFTVGLPGFLIFYWAIRPNRQTSIQDAQPLLRRVLPITLVASALEFTGITIIFFLNRMNINADAMSALMALSFIFFGFAFFVVAPRLLGEDTPHRRYVQLFFFGVLEILLLALTFALPFVHQFFSFAEQPNLLGTIEVALLSAACGLLLYVLAPRLVFKKFGKFA